MEPVFENRYFGTLSALTEFMQKFRTGPRLRTMIICVLMYAYMVFFAVQKGIIQEMKPYFIVLGIVYVLAPVIPFWYAWASMRMAKKQNDGQLPETIVTFGDKIELLEGMVHITVEYHKIVKVRRLAHSYALMTSKRTAVLLREDGFTKGTFGEFKEFLRSKRPDLKIPE